MSKPIKPNQWEKIIEYQLEKYPKMEPVDLYKFIYQGIMGPAHLGTTYEKIRTYLTKELDGLTGQEAQMVERISGDNKYIRIDLYAFKNAGGDPDSLAKLVLKSCQKTKQKQAKLIRCLEIAARVIKNKQTTLSYQNFQKYKAKIRRDNFPVPHHSTTYIANYKPAYRVISSRIYKDRFDICFPTTKKR